jgi:hypothetical protein
MTMQTNNVTYRKSLSLLMALLLVLALPVSLRAGDGDGNNEEWTAVGSTGVVDESDYNHVYFYQGVAAMHPWVGGTATLRYNVTATDDLFGGNTTRLVARYQDNGGCSQVEICLFRYNHNNGQIDLLMSLNSNSFPQGAGFQQRFIDAGNLPAFNFNDNAYFIEVYLTRTCGGGDPRIGVLRLSRV